MRNCCKTISRISIITLHVLCIGLAFLPAGFAQQLEADDMVTAIGSSPIDAENAATTRETAIEDALANAFQSAVLELATPALLAEKFPEIGALMAGDVNRFTLGYKVLAENPTEERHFVLVQTRISRQAVEAFLAETGLSAVENPLPRVLLCVAETALDDP